MMSEPPAAKEGILVGFATIGSEEDGRRLARTLVEKGLAACVNIIPAVRSIYRWKGVMEEEQEVLLVIKTGEGHLEALKRAFRESHPYEVPELIVVPVVGGLEAYMEWVRGELEGVARRNGQDR